MLRYRNQPVDLFAMAPQLGLRFDPQLAQLDRLLNDDVLFATVRADLAHRYLLTPVHGRRSTPVEVILRMLVVMHLYGWNYVRTVYFAHDSLVLRQFFRVYLEKVPADTTLIRWANTVGPATLQALNDRAVQLARSLKVTRGPKLRVDTTDAAAKAAEAIMTAAVVVAWATGEPLVVAAAASLFTSRGLRIASR